MPSNKSYTIMPAGSDLKGRCWKIRTKLEKILIVATAITCLIIIILAILVSKKSTHEVSQACSTTICLNEAAKVMQYIDTKIDPCENFYQFACGNFLKKSHGDESLQFINRLEEQGKREVLEVYREPIGDNEHFMVKSAKELFQTCINENGLEKENLRSIKRSITEAGGWPILDGDKWNETKFDWLKATYKLRKLGYHFSAFLDLQVEPEVDSSLLKVTFPDVFDYSSVNFNKLDYMVETALAFGAENRMKVESELKDAQTFLVQLQLAAHSHYNLGNFSTYTVGKYQQKYGAIEWLQFLNNLTEPVLIVKKNDTVIFPPALPLKNWIDEINNTPKRTQANYLMWLVIEKILPYMPDKYLDRNIAWRKQITLQEKCLERIHDKFTPNPIDILLDRKYLPKTKKQNLEKFITTIETEFLKVLDGAQDIADESKKVLLDKAKSIQIVIGQPDDYFDDNILNNIAVDMVDNKDDSFLALIAQANRNKQSFLYSTVKNPASRRYEKWYIKAGANLPVYNEKDNILFGSTMITEKFIYDENRPSYLNYGVLGTAIGQQLSLLPLVHFAKYFPKLNESLKCFKKIETDFKANLDNFMASRVMQYALSSQLSYSAYQSNKKDEEYSRLMGVNYTLNQLFWISTASILCEPLNRYSPMHPSLLAATISGFIRNHPEFVKEFKCAEGSKMNPTNKCKLL